MRIGWNEGTDYATISDITISAGSTTGTTSLDPTDDSVYEDDEAVTVTIDGVSEEVVRGYNQLQ